MSPVKTKLFISEKRGSMVLHSVGMLLHLYTTFYSEVGDAVRAASYVRSG